MAKAMDTAYERIREAILNGHFKPGDRLTEAQLVAFTGFSRTPVRAALNRLTAENFVETRRNYGSRVCALDTGDVDDLFELRALLEGFAARRAATRATAGQLAAMRSAVDAMNRILAGRGNRQQKITAFLKHNRKVHAQVWAASGSARLVAQLELLVEQALQQRTAQAFTLQRLSESHHHHQELLQALEDRDEVWAEAVMRSHIKAAHSALTHQQTEHRN